MKVILDGVFNHCGSFNKWMDRECIYENQEGYEKGAFVSKDSPYNTFFKFYNDNAWPYNTTYDGWWGHDTLPKLNYEDSPKLVEYIMKIAKNGCHLHIMQMDGDLTWLRIWDIPQSTTTSSGASSGEMLKRQIRMR